MLGPDAKELGTLTEPREFNLMFKTYVGALGGEESVAFLRPETAQGIFVNFKNVVDSTRVRVPFGIAQIGKSFRNEITPRNFTFRSREFEQMEIEFFCHPRLVEAVVPVLARPPHAVVHRPGIGRRTTAIAGARCGRIEPLLDRHGRHRVRLSLPAARANTANWRASPIAAISISAATWKASWIPSTCPLELEKDADGKPRWRGSGKDLTYRDDLTGERFTPHVIEPSAGADRADAGVPVRSLHRRRGAGRKRQAAERDGACNCIRDWRPIKAAVLPAGEEGRHARNRPEKSIRP